MYLIENIVIGNPIYDPIEIFARDMKDWTSVEQQKTLFTEVRYLPQLLVITGIVKSTSEVKRNKPELCVELHNLDFIKIKWGKKFLHILVGE